MKDLEGLSGPGKWEVRDILLGSVHKKNEWRLKHNPNSDRFL